MDSSRASLGDWILIFAVFGSAFLYCLWGVLSGHLYIPDRWHGGFGVYSGPAAWVFLSAVGCLWLGVSVREGFLNVAPRARLTVEMTLLVCGVVGLGAAGYLPTVTRSL
jgi:hypothetical protein